MFSQERAEGMAGQYCDVWPNYGYYGSAQPWQRQAWPDTSNYFSTNISPLPGQPLQVRLTSQNSLS